MDRYRHGAAQPNPTKSVKETTDEHRCVLLGRKSFAIRQGFFCVLLGAQASCLHHKDTKIPHVLARLNLRGFVSLW